MSVHPDKKFERYLDKIITVIAKAQAPDGYLYTWRALKPEGEDVWAGPERGKKGGRDKVPPLSL